MWRDVLVRNGRRIIDGELARLARRSPELGQGELAAIDRTLEQLLDRLIVERVGRLAEREPELADRAAALFDPGSGHDGTPGRAGWPKLRP